MCACMYVCAFLNSPKAFEGILTQLLSSHGERCKRDDADVMTELVMLHIFAAVFPK